MRGLPWASGFRAWGRVKTTWKDLHRQEVRPARREPPLLGERLALRAVPVPTGGVGDPERPADVAGLGMPAQGGLGVAEGRVVEEAEGAHRDAAGAPGEVLLPEHADEVRVHLGRGQLIRRAMMVPGQASHRREVALARALGHPPDEQVIVRPRPQPAHDTPPVLT